MGCPIRGDLKYGYPRSNAIGSIHLHAQRIKLVHPVQGTQLLIEAPLPANDAVWAAFSNIAV
jgi:23S rRNA pseudouridine1911/1915/1917 synthase